MFFRPSRPLLLFGSFLTVFILLLLSMVFLAWQVGQSEQTACQALLARKILESSENVPKRELFGGLDADEIGSPPEWNALTALGLLRQGGMFAGVKFSAIKNHEIVFLIESMLSLKRARENAVPGTPSSISMGAIFEKKAESLVQIMVFREVVARNKIREALWGAAGLVFFLALVSAGIGVHFLSMKKQFRRERQRSFFFQGLLAALPRAGLLLDENLDIKLINRAGKRLLGLETDQELSGRFERYCRDASLLKDLRSFSSVSPEVSADICSQIFAESRELAWYGDESRQTLLSVIWFHVLIAGKGYFWGILEASRRDQSQDLNQIQVQEQMKELSGELFRVQDNERRLLADELHDGLCQSLAALKMQVARVEKRLELPALKDECLKMRQFIAQIIEDTRRLSHDLSPVVLDDLGLGDALAQMVNNFAALKGIKVSISIPDLDEFFSRDASRHIYRIVQESLNNIEKHAKASLVLFAVEDLDDGVSFSIKDDGIGFVVEQVSKTPSRAGLGLASMTQRVQLLDGTLQILSRPGKGTEVKFLIPKKR
ncbi:MAG: sensor histidine kinase [Deltaproteobacteria bacterium]|nr:sensor histidine kinase [Deltaproteobacteria bacterium]